MATPLSRLPKVRSEPLRQSARGQPCSLRLPGCLPGNETVVLAHLPVQGKGTSTKVTDLAGVYACHSCHDVIDKRRPLQGGGTLSMGTVYLAMLNALVETQARMVEAGIITVKGGDIL